jgi:hypothetical protein
MSRSEAYQGCVVRFVATTRTPSQTVRPVSAAESCSQESSSSRLKSDQMMLAPRVTSSEAARATRSGDRSSQERRAPTAEAPTAEPAPSTRSANAGDGSASTGSFASASSNARSGQGQGSAFRALFEVFFGIRR